MLWSYAVLAPVSKCYPPVRDRLLTRYSPVRHSNRSLRPEGLPPQSPFDLHVLSTPPAFVLSQDQTLMFNPSLTPPSRSGPRQRTLPFRLREHYSKIFLTVLRGAVPRFFAPSGTPRSAPLRSLFSVSFSRFVPPPQAREKTARVCDSLMIISNPTSSVNG